VSSSIVPGLIDTPVLVEWKRGLPAAILFLVALNRQQHPQLSQLSAMELLAACQTTQERDNVRLFLFGADVYPISTRISRRACALLDTVDVPTELTPSDAIIAATALDRKLSLYTTDPARFAVVPGLATIQPY
jgi:predicted nucleic acid-binding protein